MPERVHHRQLFHAQPALNGHFRVLVADPVHEAPGRLVRMAPHDGSILEHRGVDWCQFFIGFGRKPTVELAAHVSPAICRNLKAHSTAFCGAEAYARNVRDQLLDVTGRDAQSIPVLGMDSHQLGAQFQVPSELLPKKEVVKGVDTLHKCSLLCPLQVAGDGASEFWRQSCHTCCRGEGVHESLLAMKILRAKPCRIILCEHMPCKVVHIVRYK